MLEREPVQSKAGITRMEFLGQVGDALEKAGTAAVFGLLAKFGLGCRRATETSPVKTSPPPPAERFDPAPPRGRETAIPLPPPVLPEDLSIALPKVEIDDHPLRFAKPANLEMEDDQFTEWCHQLAYILRERVAALSGPIDANFIADFAELIGNSQPAIQKIFGDFLSEWNKTKEVPALIDYINNYLKPAGLFIHTDIRRDGSGTSYNVFEILKSAQVKVTDGNGSFTVPALHLGKPLVKETPGQEATLPQSTVNAPIFSTVLHFPERTQPALREALQIDPINGDVFANMARVSVLHEAIHVLMVRNLPTVGRDMRISPEQDFAMDLKIGDQVFSQPFKVTPLKFNELCGVGFQLSQTELSYFELLAYIQGPEVVPPNYAMVSAIVPLAILQFGPDTPLKQEILKEMYSNGGNVDMAKLATYVKNPPFELKHTHRIGQLLYRIGLKWLKEHQAANP